MRYDGPTIRWSNRMATLANIASKGIMPQDVHKYDMRTLQPMIKSGCLMGSIKQGFYLSEEGRLRVYAMTHTDIFRTRPSLKIPDYVLTYHTPVRKATPMQRKPVATERTAAQTSMTA
jgi:hypothetical protein